MELKSTRLIAKFGIKIEELPSHIQELIRSLDEKMNGDYNEDDVVKIDSEISDNINNWLNEEIDTGKNKDVDVNSDANSEDDDISDSSEEEIISEESLSDKILSSLDSNHSITVKSLSEILGRKTKYPIEIIDNLRLVKMFMKDYYILRNHKEILKVNE